MRNWIILSVLFLATRLWGQQDITWSGQIGCLVYSHCTPCHNDKGIAPFSLSSYQDGYQFRYAMEAAVAGRIMPPWPPSEHDQLLAGSRSLSSEEVDIFRKWVAQGAPEGDPDLAPDAPIITTNQEILDPDLSVRLPDYEVPDLREHDLYRCFVVMTNQTEDRYITGVEILPGNRGIVHHVILYQDTSQVTEELDKADPTPGYTCFGGAGSGSASMITGWVPGSSATYTPVGMGIFFPKGARLIAQLHYPEGSAGEVDSTRINIRFSENNDLRRMETLPVLNHFSSMDRPLFIPANTRQTFHQRFSPVPFKVSLTGIAPHAHLICESMKAFATTIDGDTIPLIDIPHWDFEWQGFYSFKKPVIIPPLATVHGIATYNNTTSNHHLPGDVPVDVSVGEATTDEMMLFFMSIALYEEGDENMVIDTASHKAHLNGCTLEQATTPTHDQNREHPISIGPNPCKDQLFVSIASEKINGRQRLILFDLLGRAVWKHDLVNGINSLHIPSVIPGGTYLCAIEENNRLTRHTEKLVLIR